MKNYICNEEKYAYGKGYIHLPIQISELPSEVEIDGDNLTIKSSFHVSLVCVKNLIEKYGAEYEQKIIDKFCEFISTDDISFLRFTGEFRVAKSEEKETLIARCEVSNLEKLFKKLSSELNIEIPLQPTHVTLYTLQLDIGIGLNSFKELEEKSVVINEIPHVLESVEYRPKKFNI